MAPSSLKSQSSHGVSNCKKKKKSVSNAARSNAYKHTGLPKASHTGLGFALVLVPFGLMQLLNRTPVHKTALPLCIQWFKLCSPVPALESSASASLGHPKSCLSLSQPQWHNNNSLPNPAPNSNKSENRTFSGPFQDGLQEGQPIPTLAERVG